MPQARLAALVVLQIVLLALVTGGLLFLPAGSWRYWEAWAYLAVTFVPTVAVSFSLLVRDPEFLKRRMKWREREGRQPLDRILITVLYFAVFVISGLDHRHGWSRVPAALVILGDAAVLGAYLAVFRVFEENRYAASTIEVEAGQQVISSGPYAVVRHPMYLAALPLLVFTPLALGSYWALLAVPPMIVGLVIRIRDEEALLRRALPGYEEYRRKVRWRLLPGIW